MREYTYQFQPENYDDPDAPILKITKSSFGSYNWCPKKYEFSYIDKLPQDQTEAMVKGTIIHNAREDFFNAFDIKKAENLSHAELVNYCMSLHPIDDYTEMYEAMSIFEANRFLEAKAESMMEDFIPVVNEVMLDAEITIEADGNEKFPLTRDYVVHLQGIIDRIFLEDGKYILMELKTGIWKDSKRSNMRGEMAYYKLLFEQATDEELIENGLDPNIPITHWGWFYPDSNFLYVEDCVRASETAVRKKFAKLIQSYETGIFPASYYYKKCVHCAYMPICDAAIENQLFDDW